jgi:hypothetical protein
MHHHTANCSQAWHYSVAPHDWSLAGTVGRGYDPIGQSYDLTGQSYAVDRSPHVKTDGTGHAVRRPNHYQATLAFNALATV